MHFWKLFFFLSNSMPCLEQFVFFSKKDRSSCGYLIEFLFLFLFCLVLFLLEEVNSIALTGFDGDTYRRSIVLMRLTHCVRPPLVNLYRERTAQCPEKYNTLFVGAPLGRPLSMRQTKQKNLLPSCLDAINLSNACFSLFVCLFGFFFLCKSVCVCVCMCFLWEFLH